MKNILFENKKNCCACGACMNVCPVKAISMLEDELGFIYPVIDSNKCTNCGMCRQICGFQKEKEKNIVLESFAASSKDIEIQKKSASGGLFAQLAKRVIEQDGIVYGATQQYKDKNIITKHIGIEQIDELFKLQGSKYVQSSIDYCFQEIKKHLEIGRRVLFSGTPCQVDGLKSFLKKDYEGLIKIEIICHGVPNEKVFNDFLTSLNKKYSKTIVGFVFRDKSKGQDYTSRIIFNDKSTKVINGKTTSYIKLYLKQLIQRENCYECPYSTPERVADITLGDFWKVEKEFPQKDFKELFAGKAISCVLINTEKGKQFFNEAKDDFILKESEKERIIRNNDQLHKKPNYDKKREIVFDYYSNDGYKGIEKFFKENYRGEILKHKMAWYMPMSIRNIIKKLTS